MFDVGFWELVLVGVVALIVVGPERLPELARTAGRWLGTARRMAATFKADLEREVRAEELKKILEKQSEFRGAYEIVEQTKKDLEGAVEQLNSPLDAPPAAGSAPTSLPPADSPAVPPRPETSALSASVPPPAPSGDQPAPSSAHGPEGPPRV